VFLLHEVFGYDYKEIAGITGKSETNCRQILTRARHHVDDGKPRFDASREQREEVAAGSSPPPQAATWPPCSRWSRRTSSWWATAAARPGPSPSPLSGAEQVVRLVLGLYRRAPKMGVHSSQPG
jgi:DNA-directed RNA polymerase specialized sigma subunit, sigma24 homolog